MNRLMFFGGFGLAITLFIMAVLFFIIFKVPSIHRYFKKNKKTGLVEAAAVEGQKPEKYRPKRVTRQEYENMTEVISLSDAGADRIEPDRTSYLTEDGMPTETVTGSSPVAEGTEILGGTEILK